MDIPPRSTSDDGHNTNFQRARMVFSQPTNSNRRLGEHDVGFSPPRQRSRRETISKSASVPVSLASLISTTGVPTVSCMPVPDSSTWSPSNLTTRVVDEDSNGTTFAPSIAASSTGVSSVFGRMQIESPMDLSEIEETDTVIAPIKEDAIIENDKEESEASPPLEDSEVVLPLKVEDLATSPPPSAVPEEATSTTAVDRATGSTEKPCGLVNSPSSESSAPSTPTTAVTSSQTSSTPTATSSSQSTSTPPPKRRSPIPETEFKSPFQGQRRMSADIENDVTSPRHGLPKVATNYAVVPRIAQLKRTANRRPLGDLYLNIANFVETRSFATRTLTFGRESQSYRERGGKFPFINVAIHNCLFQNYRLDVIL